MLGQSRPSGRLASATELAPPVACRCLRKQGFGALGLLEDPCPSNQHKHTEGLCRGACVGGSRSWRGPEGGPPEQRGVERQIWGQPDLRKLPGARLGPPTSRRPERLQPLPQTSSGFLGDACLHEGHNHGAVPSGVLFLK